MGWWLATDADADRARRQAGGWIKRFDPRFWTVNFPRPMMAGVTTTAPDALRVDAVFYRTDDLAGLIWEAADTIDHPLLRYETARDFRQCTLAFRWRSSGLMPLDAINGPTLTIEGRDASGGAKSWYVRLWNYAEGTPEDAMIRLDFGAMDGGFTLPADADPVWAGDIDRMFVSLVPPGYTGISAELAAPAEAWVELTGMVSDGAGSTLAIGDGLVPPHGLMIATGYDDAYNQTPARVLRQILALGYRGAIDHYVGMSHYFRLEWNAGAGLHLVSLTGGTLNVAAEAWHKDFLARAAALGFEVILSMSYELLDQHCWNDWKQRAADGSPALTGWDPPSTLLSPASDPAMNYLCTVATAFATLAAGVGSVHFQIGEPWWWTRADGTICLHDDAARAALGTDADGVASLIGPQTDAQKAVLDAAGALLSASTATIGAAVRAVAPDADLALLAYLPTVLDPRMPEAVRANMPVGWASPAFDRLQLEDYDWVQAGDTGVSARGAAFATERLGYPPGQQDYFSGFVLNASDAATFWPRIEAAARAAQARGTSRAFIWALPQVARDGFTVFDSGEESAVQAFDDVDFPLSLGAEASVAPAFSTAIVTTAAGVEQRNADWADARLRFDAGPGVRSEEDIATLIAFFRARRGAARAFRFRDPFDASSGGAVPTPLDQPLGIGDGTTASFPLVKRYGEGNDAQVRRITRPVAGSLRVAVGGAEAVTGWSLLDGGIVSFVTAPAPGAEISAGYLFDVPVRFAEDSLEVGRSTFLAGEAPTVPLIEVREA
ncbi:DUF2460 domain-containing protein [Sphingomonas sp. CGMCC 1.13654]|uniref:DUF2460 domain-containing protein n=1 Tax=Sphingomonas chungangi TaxID=2683589 RepID=A0A838L5X6_9SPHN|nr:DUF2460 domain-containing protein [Sphingomonas chungangi]MBA2932988.1 DUF2460 domain-containing protein [Sphingomonas chungangi]MVW56608.1 TIGR02217 family protein [Sphingomonas chungangi]